MRSVARSRGSSRARRPWLSRWRWWPVRCPILTWADPCLLRHLRRWCCDVRMALATPPAAENAADGAENPAAKERAEGEESYSVPVQSAHLPDSFVCDL